MEAQIPYHQKKDASIESGHLLACEIGQSPRTAVEQVLHRILGKNSAYRCVWNFLEPMEEKKIEDEGPSEGGSGCCGGTSYAPLSQDV